MGCAREKLAESLRDVVGDLLEIYNGGTAGLMGKTPSNSALSTAYPKSGKSTVP